jgi:hypothetical protein
MRLATGRGMYAGLSTCPMNSIAFRFNRTRGCGAPMRDIRADMEQIKLPTDWAAAQKGTGVAGHFSEK